MDKKEMEEMVEEAFRSAEEDKRALLEDFPDIEEIMSKTTRDILPIATGFSLEEVMYKSLLTGATIVAKKYREARRVERDLLDRCKANIKN